MREYIDKSGLYKKIVELEEIARDRYIDIPTNSPLLAIYKAQLDERTRFKHMVADFPTIDPESIIEHGKWIEPTYIYIGAKRYVCDQCKDDEYWRIRFYTTKENYCPNCGAKMDGEEEKC